MNNESQARRFAIETAMYYEKECPTCMMEIAAALHTFMLEGVWSVPNLHQRRTQGEDAHALLEEINPEDLPQA